ncbi:salicylate hydroxylase [Mycena crocata]|nr:salicylate hydroxylase [Mycena crocata]
MAKTRVAIAGGGIGGIIAAIALSKCENLEITMYEATAAFGEIGVGLGMNWRAWRILELLELHPYLLPLLPEVPSEGLVPTIMYRKSDMAVGQDIFMCYSNAGYTRFRRADFHAAIVEQLEGKCKTICSKRLVSYTDPSFSTPGSTEPITLNFADGTTATCDFLIGADGIKSAVRKTMYETAAAKIEAAGNAEEAAKLRRLIIPKFSGVEVFRTVIPTETLRAVAPGHASFTTPTQFLGKEKHIMCYPIAKNTLFNTGIYKCDYTREGTDYPEPWVTDVTSEDLASLYPGWEPDVQAILKCVDPIVSRWAICTVTGLPFFNSSRVILLGDSAHAMTNFQGAGAGQAIEDAYILQHIFSDPRIAAACGASGSEKEETLKTIIPKALAAYSAVRQPFSDMVLKSSRQTGVDCALHDDEAAKDLEYLGKRMQEEMEWAWVLQPEEERDKALGLVEKIFKA